MIFFPPSFASPFWLVRFFSDGFRIIPGFGDSAVPNSCGRGPSPGLKAKVVSRSRHLLNQVTTYLPPQLRCISKLVLGSNSFCASRRDSMFPLHTLPARFLGRFPIAK